MMPIAIGLVVWQGAVSYGQRTERDAKYRMARAYADSVGKPLVVVGGPYGSTSLRNIFGIPAHGYGDICIDIDPAACQGAPQFIEADIRSIPLTDKYAGAIFASHVLEHLPTVYDAEKAWDELHRVADAVFVCVPAKNSIWGWLHPEHHLWISQDGAGNLIVEQR